MPGIDFNQLITVSSLKPAATPDGKIPAPNARGGRYLEQYVMTIIPNKSTLADEGSYFTANNGQTGQATAANVPLVFSANVPNFIVYNTATPGISTSPKIYLDYVLWAVSAAPTGTTSVQFAVVRDIGNRLSSVGTGGATLTPIRSNSAGPSSIAAISSGGQMVATTATSSAVTFVGNRILRGSIPIVNDVYILQFGSVDSVATTVGTIAAATHILEPLPPLVINPNESALIYLWYPGMSAAQTNLPEIGWYER